MGWCPLVGDQEPVRTNSENVSQQWDKIDKRSPIVSGEKTQIKTLAQNGAQCVPRSRNRHIVMLSREFQLDNGSVLQDTDHDVPQVHDISSILQVLVRPRGHVMIHVALTIHILKNER